MNEQVPPPVEPGSAPSFRTSSASRFGGEPPPADPLLKRALVMPFSPTLWRDAAGSPLGQIVAPLVLLSLLTAGVLAVVRGGSVKGWIKDAADTYEAKFDPVVVEGGQVKVDGERLPIWSDDKQTFLVDPEEVFATGDLKTPEWVVVRRDVIVRKQLFQEQRVPVRDLMDVLGRDRLVVDGPSIRRFGERFGTWLQLGVALFLVVFSLVADAALAPVYAVMAAGTLISFRRTLFAGALAPAFRMALATYSIPIVASLLIHLLGVAVPCCLSAMFWPLVMTVACMIAVGDRATPAL